MIKMNVVMKMIGATMLCLLALISLPSYSHADVDRRLLVKLTLEGKPISGVPVSLASLDDEQMNPLKPGCTQNTIANGTVEFNNLPTNLMFSAFITNFPPSNIISGSSTEWMKESGKIKLTEDEIDFFNPRNQFVTASTSKRLFDPIVLSDIPSTNSITIDFKLEDLVETSLECCVKNLGEFETAPNTFRCFKTDIVSIRLVERFPDSILTNMLTPKRVTSNSDQYPLTITGIIDSIESDEYSALTNYIRYSTTDISDVSNGPVIAIESGLKVNLFNNNYNMVKTNSFQINPFTSTIKANGGVFFGDSFIDYDNNGRDECGEVQVWQKPDVYIPTIKYWLTTSGDSTVPNSEKTFRTNGRNLEENKYTVSNLVKAVYYKLNIAYPEKYLAPGYNAKEKHGFRRVSGYPKHNRNVTYSTTTGTESNVLSVIDAFAVKIPSTTIDEYDFEYKIYPDVGYTPTLICSEYDNSVSVYTNEANHTFNMQLQLTPDEPKAILISNYTAKATFISEDASTVKELDDLDLSGLSTSSNNHRTNPITFNFSFTPEESGKLILNISALGIAPMYNGNSFKFNTGLSKNVSADFILTNVVKRDLGEQVMSRSEFLDLMENKGVEPLNEIRSKFGLADYVYEPSDQFVTNRNEQTYFKEAINELAKMTNSIVETAIKEFIPNEYIYSGINEFNTNSYFFNEQKLYKTTIGSGWFDKIINSQLHSPCNWVYYLDTAKHQGHAFSSKNKSDNPIFNLETGEIAVDNPINYTHWFTWVGSTESGFTDAFCYFPCLRYLHWPESGICHQKMIKRLRCSLNPYLTGLITGYEYGFNSENDARAWATDSANQAKRPRIEAVVTNDVKDVLTGSEPIIAKDTQTVTRVWKLTYKDGKNRASNLTPDPTVKYKLYGQSVKILSAPSLSSYNFIGWRINWPNYWFANDLYSDNLSPTFTAVWKQQETKAISINNGTITLDHNAFKKIPDDNPLRTQLGYTHWVENNDDGTFYAVKTDSTATATISYNVTPKSSLSTGTHTATLSDIKFSNVMGDDQSIEITVAQGQGKNFSYTPSKDLQEVTTFMDGGVEYKTTAASPLTIRAQCDYHNFYDNSDHKYDNKSETIKSYVTFGGNATGLYFWSTRTGVTKPEGDTSPALNGSDDLSVDITGKNWGADRAKAAAASLTSGTYFVEHKNFRASYSVTAYRAGAITKNPNLGTTLSISGKWEDLSTVSYTYNFSGADLNLSVSYSIQADKIDRYYSIQLKDEWDEMVDNDGVMESKHISKTVTMPAVRYGQNVKLDWFDENHNPMIRTGFHYTQVTNETGVIYNLTEDYPFDDVDPDEILIFRPVWIED